VYSFLVHAPNLQILRIEQGSTPRIDRSFLLCFSCCYRVRKALCTEFFSYSPHLDQFLRPLDLICVSVTIVRRHDVTPPSFSATVLTTPRPHGLTLLSSVLSTPDTRMVKRPLRPRSGYKREPLPRTANAKAPFPYELDIANALVLPPASLGHTATRTPLPYVSLLAEQAVLPSSSPTSRRSSE
jgi:hypothetical protein